MWDVDLTQKKFAFGNCVSPEKNNVVYSAFKIRWHFVILNEWICTDIYLLRFLKDSMKPYSSSIGDIFLGMVFSRKNIGSLGFVEIFQHIFENMQKTCRVYSVL